MVRKGQFDICYWSSSGSRIGILHFYWHLVVKNGNFTLLLTSSGQELEFHIATAHLALKNGDFPLLLTSSGQQMARFRLLLTSSGQEWKFHISIDIYWSRMAISHCYSLLVHSRMAISHGYSWFHQWWRMAIWHCYWHLKVMNGNSTFPCTSQVNKNGNFTWSTRHSSSEEWEFHIATDI